jgi:hypothetical protein
MDRKTVMCLKLGSSMAIGGLLGFFAFGAAAQTPAASRLGAIKARLDQIRQTFERLPPKHQALVDGYSHPVHLSRVFDKLEQRISRAQGSKRALAPREPGKALAEADPNVSAVNDPSTDLDFSSFDGLTQSETHTAMCGNQVVVGFNDTGSLLQTDGLSIGGAAVSSDRGRTFRDIGAINTGSDLTLLFGDPVLNCSDPSTFFYTQISPFFIPDPKAPPGFFLLVAGLGISKSTDGGNTWGNPVTVTSKDGFTHFLDKEWTAIDPSNPSRMYVSYTDFDLSGTSTACPHQARAAIEVVASTDAGQTFGAPAIVDEVCGFDQAVQASHLAVSSRGTLYVLWERFTTTATELRITSIAPGGKPLPSVLIDQKVPGGDTFLVLEPGENSGLVFETDLQGEFRDQVGIDLAVDRSGGPNDGTVYVVWDDGRGKSISDIATAQTVNQNADFITAGSYAFTDVLFSRATDGVHFSPATQVNSDRQPLKGRRGHDHFQPAIAVDPSGTVGICWYDRRNDPQNFRIERFCARSKNGGKSWDETRVKGTSFAPLHRMDFIPNPAYMGDYDGLTSDFNGKTRGFVGAFQVMSSGMNPDVKAFRFE